MYRCSCQEFDSECLNFLSQLALIVAQERDKRSNKLSGIKLSALETGLKKVCKVALEKKGQFCLPQGVLSQNEIILVYFRLQ